MKAPAYQWYPKDALSDERYRRMNITQRGLYRELLDLQWLEGSIPSDPLEIASCLKVDRRLLRYSLPIVLQMFEATSGDCSRLVNHKLEEQRQKQERFIEAKRNSGRTGAAKRWNDSTPNGSAIAAPIAHPMANDSSASAIAFAIKSPLVPLSEQGEWVKNQILLVPNFQINPPSCEGIEDLVRDFLPQLNGRFELEVKSAIAWALAPDHRYAKKPKKPGAGVGFLRNWLTGKVPDKAPEQEYRTL